VAVPLTIIAFFLSLTTLLAAIPAVSALITICLTICIGISRKCLFVGVALAIVSSITAFVTASVSDGPVRIVSIIGGLLWLLIAFLVYKIPPHDPNSQHNSNAPTIADHEIP
jgi:uncharacterized membrane protein